MRIGWVGLVGWGCGVGRAPLCEPDACIEQAVAAELAQVPQERFLTPGEYEHLHGALSTFREGVRVDGADAVAFCGPQGCLPWPASARLDQLNNALELALEELPRLGAGDTLQLKAQSPQVGSHRLGLRAGCAEEGFPQLFDAPQFTTELALDADGDTELRIPVGQAVAASSGQRCVAQLEWGPDGHTQPTGYLVFVAR